MITYRSNKTDTLRAAYIGTVRVGYVEKRSSFTQPGWRWQLILLRPEGGAYWGVENDEESARTELQKAMDHWLACAGLHTAETTNDNASATGRELRDPAPDDAGRHAKARKRGGDSKAKRDGARRTAGRAKRTV